MQPDELVRTIEAIRAYHRQRCYAMDQRKRVDLALGSYLRTQLGWRKDGSEDQNKIARALTKGLMEHGETLLELNALRSKDSVGSGREKARELRLSRIITGAIDLHELYEAHADVIEASILARAPFDKIEASATSAMESLAEALPVWGSWAKDVRGFSSRCLATIVAEAGDLSAYPTKGHLWKRMGLALVDGKRQGAPGLGASAMAWMEHGYSPKRRSLMFVIGDLQVKVGDKYRAIYLKRKEYEVAKAEAAGLKIVPAAKIPKKSAAQCMSEGHVHRRAQRYMEKRLLRDLWQAWRRTTAHMPLKGLSAGCPPPNLSQREAA